MRDKHLPQAAQRRFSMAETHPLIVDRWEYIERGLRDILALMLNIKTNEAFPSFVPSTTLRDV